MDELVENLKTYEMKRKKDSERREPNKEKSPVLKDENNDSSEEDSDMTYLTRRFQKMVRRNGADNVVKQALATWGDSSSESEEENDTGDSFMLAVESEANEYDSIFALMAQSDDDEDDDDDEVSFRDVQRNLKSSSPKKLMSFANVLIDTYHSLVSDKDALTIELGDAEQTGDDLVICVVDLKETIENMKNENEKVSITEQERDDLLVVIADLEETIEELKAYSRPENSENGKEIASEAHIKLENELNIMKTSLCAELEKNREQWEEAVNNGSWTGYILGVGKIGKSLSHSIKNVYYVNGLKYSLLSVSQICDKGNKVEFLSKICTVTNLVTSEVVLVAKRYKNIYVADFESLQSGDMSFLKAVDDDAEMWHRRLGHANFSLLNKLIQKDLVRGFPNSKFKEHKVCDACARGKLVKSSFKPKKDVSTSNSLGLLHMDLCGPMRVPSMGGKRYIFVIVDDYSRFTWTLFLRTKDETFEVFVAFVKKIQVKMESKVSCIRSDHGTEFDNAKFDELCSENGITHNFSAPRTPQQNGVVERKNITLEDMARTMLIDNGIAKNF
ncbi:uncharacterized protein [Nicotiana tomentosiformis]|uniref:uncharacterized protein n=1 Tax=Nicotiana tomentosiformis TaxID=4098 RepID=UPI00388C4692